MFILSVRASTLKFCGTLLLGVLLVSALVIFLPIADVAGDPTLSENPAISGDSIRYDGIQDYSDMSEFLRQFGWETEERPEFDKTVTIPKNFSGSFAEYNKLQLSQGCDLQDFAGKSVQKVVFALTNYKGSREKVLATLFIYRGRVVGGDISSADPNGFVAPFEGVKDN